MGASPEYVYWVEPECNAGTAQSAYTTTKVDLQTVMLWRAEFRIPPGHAGMTGVALIDSGNFVVPFDPGGQAWLTGDDDLLEYNYGRELGTNVHLATYNTGTYNHSWQVRLIYTPMSAVLVSDVTIDVTPYTLD